MQFFQQMKRRAVLLTSCLLMAAALASCTARIPTVGSISPRSHSVGKISRNNIDAIPLPRGNVTKPIGTDTIHLCTAYKDISGMTRNPIHRVSPWQRAAGDRIEWTVTTATGTLPTYKDYRVMPCAFAAWDPYYLERFVVGRADQEYTIVVRNRSKEVLEIEVVSDIGSPPERRRDTVTRRAVEAGATLRLRGTIVDCCDLRPFRFPAAAGAGGVDKSGSVSIRVFDSRTTSIDGIPADPGQFLHY